MNILFVCTGNTCRSPMAEGLCRIKAKREGLNIHTLSAGLHAFVGDSVTENAVKAVMKKVDISDHKARRVEESFLEASDMVIAMSDDHKLTLLAIYPQYKDKVSTLSELAQSGGPIDDPYGKNQDVYDACARKIGRLLDKAWPYILEKYENTL